ncbi:MAG: alpha/beta fold hydrolase, partial [Deltaproteobacteria bacterium]|nr:alpha/beta fold hydrolase [Deltaproteobacteria bacterium]
MVLPGQFLERSVTVPSGELSLDGLFHRGKRRPACVIAAPHPALGGSMTVPAINELAWALTRAGHATLRFDYRGVGASQGKSTHVASLTELPPRIVPAAITGEVQDLLSALDQLRESAYLEGDGPRDAPVCAIGYSFGACVVLAAADDPRIERLVLIAPPTEIADLDALARVKKPVLAICAQHDPLVDRAALMKLLEPLGDQARLEIVAHADHSFRRGIVELGRIVAGYLRGTGPAQQAVRVEAEREE